MKLPAPDLSPLAKIVFEAYLRAMANANAPHTPLAPIDASKGKPNARFVPRRGTVSTGGATRLAVPPSAATVAVNAGIVLACLALPEYIERFKEAWFEPTPEIAQEHKQELMMLGRVILETTESTQPMPERELARALRRRHRFRLNKRFRLWGYTRARRGSTLDTPK